MTRSARPIPEKPSLPRLLLTCGVIGPLLFIIMFLIQGAFRPGYSPFRHTVSSLSIGNLGWIQSTNFVISGLLILASAVGLHLVLLRFSQRSFWGPFLVGLAGIGLIGAGIFTTDPFNGYPPGTPLVPLVRTTHGAVHDLFGVPVFLGLPTACLVFNRFFARSGERGWAAYSALSGTGILIAFVLTSVGLNQVAGLADFAGLFQRLTIAIGLIWITLLCDHFRSAAALPSP